jgi:hypothetical protein
VCVCVGCVLCVRVCACVCARRLILRRFHLVNTFEPFIQRRIVVELPVIKMRPEEQNVLKLLKADLYLQVWRNNFMFAVKQAPKAAKFGPFLVLTGTNC